MPPTPYPFTLPCRPTTSPTRCRSVRPVSSPCVSAWVMHSLRRSMIGKVYGVTRERIRQIDQG